MNSLSLFVSHCFLCIYPLRFTSEPTEEQHKEMDKLQDKAMGKDIGLDDDPDVIRLVKAASKLEWGLNSAPEIKKSTAAVVDLLRDSSNKRTVDIPEDNLEAIRKVGPMIVSNKDKPATEIMSLLIKHFGFYDGKNTWALFLQGRAVTKWSS